ncbi:major facilitator superfamily domain-containing protein [Geopyxis carbonaria]|nr:major facilitator superfamily domain-containing protein [Geopyxis carbonaria]
MIPTTDAPEIGPSPPSSPPSTANSRRNSIEDYSPVSPLNPQFSPHISPLSRRFSSPEVLTRCGSTNPTIPRHLQKPQALKLRPLAFTHQPPLSAYNGTPRPHSEDNDAVSGFVDPPARYHTFSPAKKRRLAYLVSLAAVFSPLSSNIYFPALPEISRDLKTSIELITLSITVYMIFQGLAPSMWGPLADKYGRRPIFMGTLGVYMAANLGLAVGKNYATLMVFRAIQAIGSSATIAVGAGTIGDVAKAAERGGLLGVFSGIRMFGQAFGPVIGGALTQYFGFRSIFYFLLISAAVVLILLTLFLPETLQTIAGDGSLRLSGIHRPLIPLHPAPGPPKGRVTSPLSFHTYLTSFQLLTEPDILATLLFGAVVYTVWSMVTSSTSSLFAAEHRGITAVQTGLLFLPNGLGCVAGSFATGALLDRTYRAAAARFRQQHGLPDGTELTQQLHPAFAIEHARLRGTAWVVSPFVAATAAYGWAMEYHIAVPLVIQFVIAFCATAVFNANSTLVIDLYPSKPASATALNNLVRCTMGAIGVGLIERMNAGLDEGVTFSVLAAVVAASCGLVVLEWRMGPKWRRRRIERGEMTKKAGGG